MDSEGNRGKTIAEEKTDVPVPAKDATNEVSVVAVVMGDIEKRRGDTEPMDCGGGGSRHVFDRVGETASQIVPPGSGFFDVYGYPTFQGYPGYTGYPGNVAIPMVDYSYAAGPSYMGHKQYGGVAPGGSNFMPNYYPSVEVPLASSVTKVQEAVMPKMYGKDNRNDMMGHVAKAGVKVKEEEKRKSIYLCSKIEPMIAKKYVVVSSRSFLDVKSGEIKLLTQFNEEVDRVGGVTDERRIVVEKKFRTAEEAMKYHLVFSRIEWDKSSVKTELRCNSIFDEGVEEEPLLKKAKMGRPKKSF